MQIKLEKTNAELTYRQTLLRLSVQIKQKDKPCVVVNENACVTCKAVSAYSYMVEGCWISLHEMT